MMSAEQPGHNADIAIDIPVTSTLKMETAYFSETLITQSASTGYHHPNTGLLSQAGESHKSTSTKVPEDVIYVLRCNANFRGYV
jgi:hypothetical protein